ncbi:MAG: class I SAM-dependent RNA methyltransferase [Deltaproteobacteria bacterium]|jgi:tRNA/tmRNA/rRNA uracil-C5-methylase (TrmA/RlmC/RlmD family)|nr:class I SAM-dependent RNA methyltransferase [Deltaproteobacteria bacterium]
MQIKIEKLIYGGNGAGEIDGKKVFVPLSAPGDILDVEIVGDHKTWSEAKILSVVETASCRVTNKCPVFGTCGGCQWQHLSYDTQLEWKRSILKETLEHIGGIENPEVLPTLASPKQWNYRNKIQLHVDSKGRIGFYKPKSKEVVEFDECYIADESLNAKLNEKREKYSKRDRGVALRVEDGPAFVQINSGQNEQIKKVISEWIADLPHSSILELYAGAGNFTFEIAKMADRTVASDVDKIAIAIAKERARALGLSNIEFIRSSSGKAAKRMQGDCDLLLMDPPRKGCADAIADILNLKPKSIIYISCNPATLARDMSDLNAGGYHFQKSMPVDMFPQTYHIESINLLSR